MAMNLFAPLNENTKKDVLVEFRAGRMNLRNDGSKMVDPDKRKGLVQLKQSPEDNLIHFIWKDRVTNTEETNLMLFPDDATFRRVEEAKGGRVFVLEWHSSDKKMFFWMQEPKDEKDKEYCDNINKYINNPPQQQQQQTLQNNPLLAGLVGNLDGLGGSLGHAQLLQQLLGGGGGNPAALGNLSSLFGVRPQGRGGGPIPRSGAGAATTGGSGGGSSGSASQPSASLSSTKPQSQSHTQPQQSKPQSQQAQQQTQQQTQHQQQQPHQQPQQRQAQSSQSSGLHQLGPSASSVFPGVQMDTLQKIIDELTQKSLSLKDILNIDAILESGVLRSPETLSRFLEHLPGGQCCSAVDIEQNLRSPQFLQALSMFNKVLRSGNMGMILSSFDLTPSDLLSSSSSGGVPMPSVEDFLRAVQKKASTKGTTASTGSSVRSEAPSSATDSTSSTGSSETGGERKEKDEKEEEVQSKENKRNTKS